MRIAIAFPLLAMITLSGCGDLGELGQLACTAYDLNSDGTTTAEEVVSGYEAVTGITPTDAEVQEFLDTYCSSS